MKLTSKVVHTDRIATILSIADDQTTWTVPSRCIEGGASWLLRFSEWIPSRDERIELASMLDSFTELINSSQKDLIEYAKAIRDGMDEASRLVSCETCRDHECDGIAKDVFDDRD